MVKYVQRPAVGRSILVSLSVDILLASQIGTHLLPLLAGIVRLNFGALSRIVCADVAEKALEGVVARRSRRNADLQVASNSRVQQLPLESAGPA